MHYRSFISLALVVAAVLAVAGCSSPPAKPVDTPTPTPVPTTVITTPPTPIPTAKASVIPGPTDVLPSQWPLSFSVEKAGMYSTTIITHFNGGKGSLFLSRLDVRVTHPDGTVVTNGIEKPQTGDTIELPGTNGMDRVEVMATMASGDVYKVIDEQVQYKSH
jgi:hypothetical protein